MKILLTGASGLLGRAVYKRLSLNSGFDVLGTAFSRAAGGLKKLDLLDGNAVKETIEEFRPDLIIHSAAERRPDVVKSAPEKAERINIEATETIAGLSADLGAALLYMSTNYVFDGKNPPYYPDSAVNPLNDYGRMKLAGEKTVTEKCPGAVILRIPILYGSLEYLGESAVTIIAEGISPDKPCYFDNKMIRFPTHADDISDVIAGLAERIDLGQDISGIYHWSSEIPYTKYAMARIFAKILGTDPELVREASPDPNAAPRPENAKLDTGRIRELGLGKNRELEPALREIMNSISS